VRKTDFHPIARRIVMGDSEEIEILEISFEVLGWNTIDAASTFGDEPATKKAEVGQRAEPEARVSLFETELAVRYALHEIGADLDDALDIQSDAQHQSVLVTGIVPTPERRQEIVAALADIPHVSTPIRTEEEVSNQALRPPVTRLEPKIRAVHLPIEKELQEYFHDAAAVENFSRQAAGLTKTLMAHAWAIRRLAERYPAAGPHGESMLGPSGHQLLQTMRRDHRRAMSETTEELRVLVRPVLQPIAGPSPEPIRSPALFDCAEVVQRLTLRVVYGAEQQNTDVNSPPEKAAQELLAVLRGLEILEEQQ
jgi:hypothetical protein